MNLMEAVLYLVLNVYHEARSEDSQAQMAVAYVTLNRAHKRELSVKQVVLQPKQFSWVETMQWLPNDVDSFLNCLQSVSKAVEQPDFTNGATHYHLDTVIPYWTNTMTYLGKYGSHYFYKKREKANGKNYHASN